MQEKTKQTKQDKMLVKIDRGTMPLNFLDFMITNKPLHVYADYYGNIVVYDITCASL